MMNKIFGCKSITHLLYGIAILLPMMSILGRVCYTVVNKNAKDSYSDVYVERAVNLDSSNVNNLYVNGARITYTFAQHSPQWNASFGFSDISLDLNTIFNVETTWNKFYLYKDNNDIMFYTTNNQTYRLNEQQRNFNTFTYAVDLSVSNDKAIYDYGVATIITFTNNKLDNAFEYSLQSFVDDNNLGNVNLFSWFTDLFLDQTNPKNALYLNFINWYMNYTLLVSSGYLLFMVLIWFTQYIRRIMDKSMYQDFGGF